MPVTVQDCIEYIDAHIYDNPNQEVTALEVNVAMKMMLEVMTQFAPVGEFPSDEAAMAANLQFGQTYTLTLPNEYGINKRGVHVTLIEE
jgi:hypothetical protein